MNNFDTQIASMGSTVGVTPAEIAALHADTLAVNYILDTVEIFKSETQERTSYKGLLFEGEIGAVLGAMPVLPTLPVVPAAVPAGVFKRVRNMVQRIKKHANYTEAIGRNLGIIGAENVIDFNNVKVQITLRRTDSDGVALDFVKGQLDGVIVYGGDYAKITKPTDPAETVTDEEHVIIWTEIGRAASSPFIDTRENQTSKPETRLYRMRYVRKQLPIGKESDPLSVVANVYKAGHELGTKVK